jgi:hypothetical protein
VLLIGFGLAVASSLALNAGYLLQHMGGASAPAVDVRAPLATVRGLLRSQVWVLGTGTEIAGSLLHIGAIAVAPLTLVQAFSAGGLALVVPASARIARSPLHRSEYIAVTVIIAALALLAIAPVATSVMPTTAGRPLLFLALVLAAAGGLAAARGARRAAALALVAGLLYGLSDAATKGFTDAAGHGLLAAVLTPWPPVIVALCAVAFFALQRGLQLGTAATVIVLMTAATNVIAVAAGVSLFAESFGARPEIAWLHGLAMLAIAAASWRLVAVQARIGEVLAYT